MANINPAHADRTVQVEVISVEGTPSIQYRDGNGNVTQGDVRARAKDHLTWFCDDGDLVLIIKGQVVEADGRPLATKKKESPFDRFVYAIARGDKADTRPVKNNVSPGEYAYRVIVVLDDDELVISPDPRIIIS